jgi:two-component sensor histidine kinase
MSTEAPPSHLEKKSRLGALARTALLDAAPDPGLDKVTKLASQVVASDVSLISFVEKDRQFFVSSCGLPEPYASERQTPLSHSFCQHVVATNKPLIIDDARSDPLVASNLAVVDLNVISYLGVPLQYDGETLGALCVINGAPRKWTDDDVRIITGFAGIIEHEIELRQYALNARSLAHQNATLAKEYHHRIKNALAVSGALVALSGKESSSVPDLVAKANSRLSALAKAHDALLSEIETVDLSELAHKLLKPYVTDAVGSTISGPPVTLTSEQVTPVCLVLHELATNSAKYGAFGNQGSVDLRWELVTCEDVSMIWEEKLTSQFSPDTPAGFGSLLLKTAAVQLNGSLAVEWSDRGLQVTVRFPIVV